MVDDDRVAEQQNMQNLLPLPLLIRQHIFSMQETRTAITLQNLRHSNQVTDTLGAHYTSKNTRVRVCIYIYIFFFNSPINAA